MVVAAAGGQRALARWQGGCVRYGASCPAAWRGGCGPARPFEPGVGLVVPRAVVLWGSAGQRCLSACLRPGNRAAREQGGPGGLSGLWVVVCDIPRSGLTVLSGFCTGLWTVPLELYFCTNALVWKNKVNVEAAIFRSELC